MELRQLKYFSAVAEQLSFTNAAQMLFVSQSAISQQISALENELGVQLLVRDKHAVSLTQAGSEFYENLQQILSTLDRAVESAQVTDLARHYAARMTIGIQADINISRAISPLLRALMSMQEEFPHLIVDVAQVAFDQVEQALLNGRVDAVVSLNPAGERRPFSKQMRHKRLFEERLMLSVSTQLLHREFGDALPDARTLLERFPVNAVTGDSGLIQQIFSIYRHYDLLPKINYFSNDLEPALRARLGHGLCLTPETLINESGNNEFLAFFDLNTDSAFVTRNLLWRTDMVSTPLQYLLNLLFGESKE